MDQGRWNLVIVIICDMPCYVSIFTIPMRNSSWRHGHISSERWSTVASCLKTRFRLGQVAGNQVPRPMPGPEKHNGDQKGKSGGSADDIWSIAGVSGDRCHETRKDCHEKYYHRATEAGQGASWRAKNLDKKTLKIFWSPSRRQNPIRGLSQADTGVVGRKPAVAQGGKPNLGQGCWKQDRHGPILQHTTA